MEDKINNHTHPNMRNVGKVSVLKIENISDRLEEEFKDFYGEDW